MKIKFPGRTNEEASFILNHVRPYKLVRKMIEIFANCAVFIKRTSNDVIKVRCMLART